MSFQDIGARSASRREETRARKERHTISKELHKSSPSQVTPSSPTSTSHKSAEPDDDSYHEPVRLKSVSKQSSFSKVSQGISHLQGMVRQLDILVKHSGDTPENQWRSRILLQSSEATDRDLGFQIRQYKLTLGTIRNPTVRSSRAKLIRDFERVHESFVSILAEYKSRQLIAISKLQGNGARSITPEEFQRRLAAKEEEDFFVRAMREREEELSKMNQSMHQVNEIYNEIGRMLEGQQEQVDAVEDNIIDAKGNTDWGFHHIERAKFPFCGPIAGSDLLEERTPPPQIVREEDFRWSMPFETMKDDMLEVQKDIVGLGQDIVRTSHRKLQATGMLKCADTVNE